MDMITVARHDVDCVVGKFLEFVKKYGVSGGVRSEGVRVDNEYMVAAEKLKKACLDPDLDSDTGVETDK